MKRDNDIIRLTKINNVRILNKHNGYLFPYQNILEIEFRNGKKRVLDLISERDITEIDYFEVVKTNKTKEVNLFKEYED